MKQQYLFATRTRVPEVTIFDGRKGNENGDSAFTYPLEQYLKTPEGKEFLDSIGVEKGVGNVSIRVSQDINKPQKSSSGYERRVRKTLPLMFWHFTNTHKLVSVLLSTSWSMIIVRTVLLEFHGFPQSV